MSGSSSDEGAARAARGRGEEGEAPPKVYEMQVGHRWPGSGRTVKPVVYRLEESEYRRLLQEAETEPEEEWEAECEVPVLQESYPGNGKVASPSLKRINALQGALRGQLSRSDSESSLENRPVNKAVPSCPVEGNKPSVPIRSDSFERNALLMDYILQSKQEAAAAVPHLPRDGSKAAEGFRQALGFAPPPGTATPDPCQNGEEDAVRKPEVDWQVAKSLERMVTAAAAARDAGKLSRQNSSQLLESREWLEEVDLELLDSYSVRKTPPAPPVRSHSKESLALSMSKTVALTEALLEPCSSLAKPAKEQRAAAGERGAEQPAGGRAPGGGGPEEQERKGRKSQEEDEKVLKVADAKKTFEKAKAAEGKAAASSAKKGEERGGKRRGARSSAGGQRWHGGGAVRARSFAESRCWKEHGAAGSHAGVELRSWRGGRKSRRRFGSGSLEETLLAAAPFRGKGLCCAKAPWVQVVPCPSSWAACQEQIQCRGACAGPAPPSRVLISAGPPGVIKLCNHSRARGGLFSSGPFPPAL